VTGRLDDLLRRWDASDPVLLVETPTSRIFRIRRGSGSAIVKNLTSVGVEDELRGAAYLAWRDGAGAVKLLDQSGDTLLLEDAGPRTLLDELDRHDDGAASGILLDVLSALHTSPATPPPGGMLPLADRFASLFLRAGADRAAGRATAFTSAADLARELLDAQVDIRPLHGDLHHGNVLHGDRGWLAIDPKGLLGDGAYDAANLFYNPLHRDDLRTDPARIRRLARAAARRLDRDPATILGWAHVDVCLSAAWHLEDGRPEGAAVDLRIAAAIDSVRAANP
jgi:streptomycin 6-kinase